MHELEEENFLVIKKIKESLKVKYELKHTERLSGKPENEEILRFLSSFAQDAIIQINEQGLIIYWNKSAERLFGLGKNDVLNKDLHQLFAPERYLELFKKAFAKFRNSGQGSAIGKTLELEGKRKNGEEFPIELSLSSFQVNGQWNAVGIIRDISERKNLETKLNDSETKHRDIINNLDVAFYQVLLGGELLNHNPAYSFILGYEASLNLKNTNVELLWENPELREVYLEQLLKDGYVKNYICHALKKDGSKVVLSLNSHVIKDKEGKPVRIDGTFIDITEKFVLEQRLIESEEHFRTITEDSHLAITILQDDLVVYTNQKMADLFGYEREEMLTWTPKEYAKTMAEDSLEFVMEQARKKQIGDPDVKLQYPIHCVKSSGEKFWVDNISTTITYNGRPADLVTLIDTTEKRKAEEKLKRTLETTRKVLETLPMGIILVGNDETIQSVNKAALSLLGYADEFEILGKNWYEITCPTENKSYSLPDHGKERNQTEVILKKKSGNEVPVLISVLPITLGDINYLLEAFVDITALKEIQNQLKESQEKYLDLIETTTLGILEINLIENKVEYANPALSDILECSLNEIKAENLFYKMVHPEDRSLLMSSSEENDVEFRILLGDGRTKWITATRLYTYGIKQQPINLRLWLIDITERKKNERLKEKFTEQLEREVEYRTKDLKDLLEKQRLYLDQIEKSSSFKTEFLATMSHELRTPLNAIIGFTELLIEGVFGELNMEQMEYIKDIDDSSKNLLDMITDVLDISKIESGQTPLKIEEIQLNNIINQVISTLKPLFAEKDIKWELVGLKRDHFIFADRIKFKQIIHNLLSNAIKFTEKGMIIFEFKESKKEWEFVVKDTGIGISEKDFDIIFQDFKRVKSHYVDATQGTGLGLALTKRLINIHGGNISFSSRLEKGTTFTFNLPKTLKEKLTKVKNIESFLMKL
ncbi:MAG: PAS domain S-box protein [Candidatus Lokiarchaeota archaeon]|nr:PAS domain S-box protein [Candidatus Lokiarchaeota archaeon]